MGFAKNLRAGLFRKIQTYSFRNVDKFTTASLVTRLTTDITNTQNALMMVLRLAVRAPIMLIGSSIMAISINPRLSIIFIVTMPILGIALYLISTNAHPRFRDMLEKYDGLNEKVQDFIVNIRVVKAFVREDHEEEKFVDRKSTRLNSSHVAISYAVFCLKKKSLSLLILVAPWL